MSEEAVSDREWWQVTRGGVILEDELNEETADASASAYAEDTEDPVCVVYCRRTEIRRYQRQVTVTATDTAAVPTLDAGGAA
jgi:hypothetical protein